ncbi:MAG TPA: hypothetical protein VFK05_26280 [Polyangiaceae bacterium]|nr:hypothetical protein [Polyangiaceae bacterium]
MIRNLFAVALCCAVCSACGSSSSPSESSGGSGNAGSSNAGSSNAGSSCPDVSGAWQITEHCDPTLIGISMNVTETSCALSFDAPFDAFSGDVTREGKITISGVQSCTGSASASAISMNCTPGTCVVKLAR